MATLRIVPRSEWGARYPDGFSSAPLPAQEVWLHHSVTVAPADNLNAEYAAMRELEEIGQSRFGGGISYTWLMMPSGRIYQGHSVNRQGAHTGGRNDISRAVCLVGNYDERTPTNAQLCSIAWLLQHAKSRGWITAARLNGGHRDLKATACPGARAYARIDDINRLAAGAPIGEDVMTSEQEAKLDLALARLDTLGARVARIEKGPGGVPDTGGIFYRVDEVEAMLIEMRAKLEQISTGNVDYAMLANAVADEQYRRQES